MKCNGSFSSTTDTQPFSAPAGKPGSALAHYGAPAPIMPSAPPPLPPPSPPPSPRPPNGYEIPADMLILPPDEYGLIIGHFPNRPSDCPDRSSARSSKQKAVKAQPPDRMNAWAAAAAVRASDPQSLTGQHVFIRGYGQGIITEFHQMVPGWPSKHTVQFVTGEVDSIRLAFEVPYRELPALFPTLAHWGSYFS